MTKKAANLAHQWIKEADAILVTASNGLAISEGLNLFAHDEKVHEVLGDLEEKYHFPNLLAGLSFQYPDYLDYWRSMARAAEYYSYSYQASSYMQDLKEIIGNKLYYIWTSNTDHHFIQAGFKNVFEVEGSWYSGICSKHPEHGQVDLKEALHKIYLKDQAGTLTDVDIPTCDKCGASLNINLAGENFVVNSEQIKGLREFLVENESTNLLVLELGIGPRNQLIKEPSMQLVSVSPNSRYITINKGELNIPSDIQDRSIGFSASIKTAFEEILSGESIGAETVGPKKLDYPKTSAAEQEKMMQNFYPNYMADQPFRPGSYPMYITVDQDHPAYLHANQFGQSWMYSMGSSAIVHCFTQDGQYYKIRLGLNKEKDELHGFYVEPGTLMAIEVEGDGFAQLNTEIPLNDNTGILLPKVEKLIELFPEKRALIERLTAK